MEKIVQPRDANNALTQAIKLWGQSAFIKVSLGRYSVGANNQELGAGNNFDAAFEDAERRVTSLGLLEKEAI